MKRGIFALVTLVALCRDIPDLIAQSNEPQPIKWNFSVISINDREAKIIFTANLERGWHIYSQFIEEGGPLPTAFSFVPDASYSLNNKVQEESTPVKEYDSIFMMPIVWYENTVIFSQHVRLNTQKATIKGKVEFMGCNGFMCLPPDEVTFSVDVRTGLSEKKSKGE